MVGPVGDPVDEPVGDPVVEPAGTRCAAIRTEAASSMDLGLCCENHTMMSTLIPSIDRKVS